MTLAILFSLKTIELIENGLQLQSGVTPLVSIRTVLLASSQSCHSVDADADPNDLFTTRQQSCGKVMLSIVSVSSQGMSHVTITYNALGLTPFQKHGVHCTEHLLVLTSSGGHWNTYGWQVVSTHPTQMLSSFFCMWTDPKKHLMLSQSALKYIYLLMTLTLRCGLLHNPCCRGNTGCLGTVWDRKLSASSLCSSVFSDTLRSRL